MSFSSIALTEDFITIMSDTQGTIDGQAQKEKYEKFKKVSPNQILSFGGTYGVFVRMLEAFPYRQEPYNMGEVAKGLEELMYNDQNKHLDSTFVLAGLDIDNELVIYQRGRDESEMLVKRPASSVQFSYLPNKEGGKLDLDDIIREDIYKLLNSKGKITPTKILKIQKKLNMAVEAVDPTVNKITRDATIKKK